ncbi:TPA: hypothetical protein SID95_004495 [Escherichia coli]|nr:hypothetical protein [Escherichia coli]EIH0662724.1 hypothetical protein [Escherichia coli O158]EIH1674787.1 hypothetical protein [Escherichia coli O157]EKF4585134.1 hypothetical protein [Escherichia coli O26]EMD2686305.1 hypothetical protein [Shigella sonnei]HDS2010417.1 hypothetical protein [Escherichia coli APEC O2-211]
MVQLVDLAHCVSF